MEAEVKKIQKAVVLTIHGTEDKTIPFADADSFAECIAQHELFPVNGADHNFTDAQHRELVASKSAAFLA